MDSSWGCKHDQRQSSGSYSCRSASAHVAAGEVHDFFRTLPAEIAVYGWDDDWHLTVSGEITD